MQAFGRHQVPLPSVPHPRVGGGVGPWIVSRERASRASRRSSPSREWFGTDYTTQAGKFDLSLLGQEVK